MRILSETKLVITPEMMANRTSRPMPVMPRSPGVHVQAVNRALGVAAGKLTDADDEDFPFEKFTAQYYPLMPALGVAWEEFRASLYSESELIWQPFELERDGIFGTPDGLIWVKERQDYNRFWECKQTTKKVQRIDSCWIYMKQGMSYCAMDQTTVHGAREVCYDVCWLLGDYTRPYKPIATTTVVEFSKQEIEQWWKIVLAAATNVKPEGKD